MPDLMDIPIEQIAEAQQLALMRLHVKVTGDTHRILLDFLGRMRAKLLDVAGEDGMLKPQDVFALERFAMDEWAGTFARWRTLFQAARRQAAWIPFAQVARLHAHYFSPEVLEERGVQNLHTTFLEQGGPRIGIGMPEDAVFHEFEPVLRAMRDRLEAILNDTALLRYSDGRNLSDRIWNLDRDSLSGMTEILNQATLTGGSAWHAAQQLEQYLGTGADCPRWTKGRLYALTKTDIAQGNQTGLILENPCESTGVAYNALRLARNEIQIAHHVATDRAFAAMPWIQDEQIVLSPSHPDIGCECEAIVTGGDGGQGIYPKGTIVLPVHVQCVPEQQTVTTATGDKPIEVVLDGDEVLTHEGRYRPVTWTFVRWYEGQVCRITTESGRVILLTPEHPVRVGQGWKAADMLEAGDRLLVPAIAGSTRDQPVEADSQ